MQTSLPASAVVSRHLGPSGTSLQSLPSLSHWAAKESMSDQGQILLTQTEVQPIHDKHHSPIWGLRTSRRSLTQTGGTCSGPHSELVTLRLEPTQAPAPSMKVAWQAPPAGICRHGRQGGGLGPAGDESAYSSKLTRLAPTGYLSYSGVAGPCPAMEQSLCDCEQDI